jgi:rubrerythrin
MDDKALSLRAKEGCVDFEKDENTKSEAIAKKRERIEKDLSDESIDRALYLFADFIRDNYQSTSCPVCGGKHKLKSKYCPECGDKIHG